MKVRTRMAPSPTGEYHVGHIATLLKNYAFAKHHGGQFILRIEDTDKKRQIPGAVEKILQVIRDFGLDWDEGPEKGGSYGPYVQSERLDLYTRFAHELIDKNQAYYCFATAQELTELREEQMAHGLPPRYDGRYREYPVEKALERVAHGEPFVIRLKVPQDQEIIFTDMIRGEIRFNSRDIEDQVLLKSDGFPTYHLAVVVDDHAMDITHVMRGEEWISSTPKHILLYQAFGWEPPVYAHIPVFLNPDGKGKMSKRKGTVSAQSFLDQGYLPEAMLNFFMILGWSHPEQKEILTLEEYIEYFDPKDISPSSVVFDLQKLAWINGMYIRTLSVSQLQKNLQPFIPASFPEHILPAVIPLVQDRLTKLSDFASYTIFFYTPPQIAPELLLKKANADLVIEQLKQVITSLQSIEHTWQASVIETSIRSIETEHSWKKNQFFMMIRVAITGETATPPLFETMEVIGADACLARLNKALTVAEQA